MCFKQAEGESQWKARSAGMSSKKMVTMGYSYAHTDYETVIVMSSLMRHYPGA